MEGLLIEHREPGWASFKISKYICRNLISPVMERHDQPNRLPARTICEQKIVSTVIEHTVKRCHSNSDVTWATSLSFKC